ncbi:MAG: TraR/DksA family transcriptional regulator [Deltaproteobacteria bacterium]|jgi:DnaK suppressor protein|nr:TraR/DksA family transcriptional regulator [Deltaproteobacteria bacterium]
MTLSENARKELCKILEDMRQEILDEVKVQKEKARNKDYTGDMGDHATSDMLAEYAHIFSERLRRRLLLIEEALEAIEDGDYGFCEECEEPISEKRLKLMPFARFCVRCQSELERRAKMRGETFTDISHMEYRFQEESDYD